MKHQDTTHRGKDSPARIIPHPASSSHLLRCTNTDRILIPVHKGVRIVSVHEIVLCEAESNYCILKFRCGGQLMISKTLKLLEEKLVRHRFVRVHARFLVPIGDIELLSTESLKLKGGQEIPVSRSKRKEVLERLQQDCL